MNSNLPKKPVQIQRSVNRQEFDHLLEKVRELAFNQPEKAVLIISDWIKENTKKKAA